MNEILHAIKDIVLTLAAVLVIILAIYALKSAVFNKTGRIIIQVLALLLLVAYGISLYLRWQ